MWTPVEGVREYEFTLRNSTDLHLKALEIQFEFPANEVEGVATRPVISKTALQPVAPVVSEPWTGGHRWTIPYFPPGDSIEFSFKAVNSTSEDCEVALFNTDRVVIQRVHGEPPQSGDAWWRASIGMATAALAAALGFFGSTFFFNRILHTRFVPAVVESKISDRDTSFGKYAQEVESGECKFLIESVYEAQLKAQDGTWIGPWRVTRRATNVSKRNCFVELPGTTGKVIEPDFSSSTTEYSDHLPEPAEVKVGIGSDKLDRVATVKLYSSN
jgi:hypothetical protein